MLFEVPEEIWSLVFLSLADVERHNSQAELKRFRLLKSSSRDSVSGDDADRYLYLVHRHSSEGTCFFPSHIASASLVSQTFRRLALPFLYRELLVQLPYAPLLGNDVVEKHQAIMKQVELIPYASLIK